MKSVLLATIIFVFCCAPSDAQQKQTQQKQQTNAKAQTKTNKSEALQQQLTAKQAQPGEVRQIKSVQAFGRPTASELSQQAMQQYRKNLSGSAGQWLDRTLKESKDRRAAHEATRRQALQDHLRQSGWTDEQIKNAGY